MSETGNKNKTPLVILVGLVVASAAGLSYVTRDKWGEPVPVATAPADKPAAETKVAEQPAEQKPETPKVEEPKTEEPKVAVAKPEETPAAEQPAQQETKPATPDTATQPDAALPSFDTVRVEPDGNAVIAGRAAPGAEITVRHNGSVIAGGMANGEGAFAITPDKPLPQGPGVLSVEMKDKATGAVTLSQQTVAVAVKPAEGSTPMVAVLTPDEPTKIVQAPADAEAKLPPMATVNIDAVDYDEKGNMIFAGRGPAGSKVQLYMDNQPLAEGAIGADGTWRIAPKDPIGVGAHALRADEIGPDGAVKSRVEIPFFREDAAKVLASRAPPPAQPATTTESKTVTVTTPDQQTTVTATAPVTVEVKPAEPAVPSAEQPAEPKVAETQPAAPAVEQPAEPNGAETQPAAPAVEQPAEPKVVETQPVAPAAEQPAEPKVAETQPVAPAAEQPAEPKVAETQPAAPAAEPAAPAPETTEQATAAATPEAQPVPDAKIIIQPGNNLWKLSRRIYGKGVMYTVIYEANRDFIRNPDLIYPGQIFVTPRAAAGTGQ